ncbi:16S rRNA (guanine(527)-N(7))-methyltransferase RsmG [Mesobacterium pallidum]|uniref:16S rRNA (guanine(527)-N(7))-methyltransferase RsmG n=1 Tax=Mesobacterium pallidum TaxID=2872037 RepID=UPI001EE21C90|nr:16S rRNA (guanine(527)-N(7))-methyltransferase RsmG [Mesobacterium pallidum]
MTAPGLGDVSRETLDRLDAFEALVAKWTRRINLVAPSTLPDIRTRHTLDSTQVFDLAPRIARTWVDLGSGGGFPGIICAILAKDLAPETTFHLIESDTRKATFLRTAIRDLGLQAQVHARRIEQVQDLKAEVVTARALADLARLLDLSEPYRQDDTVLLFPKGQSWRSEVEEARNHWSFDLETCTSKTNPAASILKITGVARV